MPVQGTIVSRQNKSRYRYPYLLCNILPKKWRSAFDLLERLLNSSESYLSLFGLIKKQNYWERGSEHPTKMSSSQPPSICDGLLRYTKSTNSFSLPFDWENVHYKIAKRFGNVMYSPIHSIFQKTRFFNKIALLCTPNSCTPELGTRVSKPIHGEN